MGDGVSGSINAPAQPTNAGRSGATPAEDAAAKAKFGEALNQENLCPPGLTRKPPENCTYLRPPTHPSQPEKKIDINIHNDPGKGPMSPRSNGPDYTKPIPKAPDNSPKIPDTRPFHDTTPSGSHVFGVEGKI